LRQEHLRIAENSSDVNELRDGANLVQEILKTHLLSFVPNCSMEPISVSEESLEIVETFRFARDRNSVPPVSRLVDLFLKRNFILAVKNRIIEIESPKVKIEPLDNLSSQLDVDSLIFTYGHNQLGVRIT